MKRELQLVGYPVEGLGAAKRRGAAGTVKALAPIAVAETGNHDRAAAAARGMNKAVFAQVNADMGKRTVEGIEEDQVAGLKFCRRQRQRRFADRAGVARQDDSRCQPEYVADKAAAIETGFGRGATQSIRAPHQADRVQRDILGWCTGLRGMGQQQGQQQHDWLHGMAICSIVELEIG